MELDELLDREGLDPDELMIWAHRRAALLLAELAGGSAGGSAGSGELARLLEPAGQIDLDGIPVRRVAVVDDMLPVSAGAARVEIEAEESITQPISLPVVHDEPNETETDAAELGTRGRRRVPSTPQPLSASELPPPPEHPRLADGEPEPMLETVDTGPIDLGTAEARAMIAANSTRMPEPAVTRQEITQVAPAPTKPPEADVEAADASEEFEIDDLEELDDEELELLEEEDAGDDEDPDAAPAPPPRPPAKPGAAQASATETPAENTDSFDIDVD